MKLFFSFFFSLEWAGTIMQQQTVRDGQKKRKQNAWDRSGEDTNSWLDDRYTCTNVWLKTRQEKTSSSLVVSNPALASTGFLGTTLTKFVESDRGTQI